MLFQIPDVLSSVQLNQIRTTLDAAKWVEDKLSEKATPDDLRSMVLNAVEATPKFISAALPTRLLPPQFYKDVPGEPAALEVNKAIRTMPGSSTKVRTDLTATIFLSDPETYEGGDLVIKNSHTDQYLKLPAGHMLLYSSGSRQEIRPLTRGASYRCTLSIQSMIRDNGQRKILFDMDTALQSLSEKMPDDPSIIKLTGVYHNLLRYWAQI